MKIALIIENFDLPRGGAERSVFEMARCFAQLSHEVSIIAGEVNRPPENIELIRIVECPREAWEFPYTTIVSDRTGGSRTDTSQCLTDMGIRAPPLLLLLLRLSYDCYLLLLLCHDCHPDSCEFDIDYAQCYCC